MNYWLEQLFWTVVLAILFVAVLWETQHLLDWIVELKVNDAAFLLREHAYTYVKWFFGTDFGWYHE